MSRGMCFSYGGFHFIPVRQFEKDEGDFFALSKRLAIDPVMGLSADAERQKHTYSHKDFYAATADKTCVWKTENCMCREIGSYSSITIRIPERKRGLKSKTALC